MRIRITFAKTEAMRFTSHLDLHRAWERTLRRAGLPLAYSQGFTPHPRINLASALPLGFTGDQEIIDVWLESEISLEEIKAAINRALPPGLQISEVREVEGRAPALQTELEASEFLITFIDPFPELQARCQALLTAEQLPRQRRGKAYDLRPLILTLEPAPENEQSQQRLFIRLAARQGATGRPEEVIDAIGATIEGTRVQRTRLIFRQESPPP